MYANTPDVRLVECAPRIGNPKIGIRQFKANAGGCSSHGHCVVSILEEFVDKATTVVLRNLTLLPNILAEALWARTITVQVLDSDVIEEGFRGLTLFSLGFLLCTGGHA